MCVSSIPFFPKDDGERVLMQKKVCFHVLIEYVALCIFPHFSFRSTRLTRSQGVKPAVDQTEELAKKAAQKQGAVVKPKVVEVKPTEVVAEKWKLDKERPKKLGEVRGVMCDVYGVWCNELIVTCVRCQHPVPNVLQKPPPAAPELTDTGALGINHNVLCVFVVTLVPVTHTLPHVCTQASSSSPECPTSRARTQQH